MKVIPREEWTNLSHRLISHGRLVCDARAPRCDTCVIGADLCPSYEPDLLRWRKRKTGKQKIGKKKMTKKRAVKLKTGKRVGARKTAAKKKAVKR